MACLVPRRESWCIKLILLLSLILFFILCKLGKVFRWIEGKMNEKKKRNFYQPAIQPAKGKKFAITKVKSFFFKSPTEKRWMLMQLGWKITHELRSFAKEVSFVSLIKELFVRLKFYFCCFGSKLSSSFRLHWKRSFWLRRSVKGNWRKQCFEFSWRNFHLKWKSYSNEIPLKIPWIYHEQDSCIIFFFHLHFVTRDKRQKNEL